MIEPEVAFCDLSGDMDLAESFVKHLIRDAKQHCAADLEFFSKFVDKELLTPPRLRPGAAVPALQLHGSGGNPEQKRPDL